MARLNRNEAGSNVRYGNVAVTAVVQSVVDSRSQRVSVTLRNNGSTDLFYGGNSNVTISNGYPLRAGEEEAFEDYNGALFVVCASTGDLRFWEVY